MVLFPSGGRRVVSRAPVLYGRRVLWSEVNGGGELDDLLGETRDLLAEASTIVEGSLGRPGSAPVGLLAAADATILSLYEELRRRLDQVDDRHVKALLERIARNVQRLSSLEGEVDRVHRLRDAIGRL
ncbi:MAG: hypothetical protein V3R77_01155 [Candidatus Binatia bacterium]